MHEEGGGIHHIPCIGTGKGLYHRALMGRGKDNRLNYLRVKGIFHTAYKGM